MAIGTALTRWRLDGRRALVTGGTKGIGAAVVAELLGLGAQVMLVARAEADVEKAVGEAQSAGHAAHGIAADITAAEARVAVVEYAVQTMGGIDILVNNAGTNIRGASVDFRPEDYAHVLNTNLTAAWEMCRVAHPHLKAGAVEGSDACIVGVGSVAGATYIGSGAPYALSKAALDHLTRYLAVEWAGDGIRVNGVDPWYTKTPLANRVLDDPAFTERVLKRTRSAASPTRRTFPVSSPSSACLLHATSPDRLSLSTAATSPTARSDEDPRVDGRQSVRAPGRASRTQLSSSPSAALNRNREPRSLIYQTLWRLLGSVLDCAARTIGGVPVRPPSQRCPSRPVTGCCISAQGFWTASLSAASKPSGRCVARILQISSASISSLPQPSRLCV